MSKQSFFIWNGVDCRSMGVRLSGPVPIVRPEERVEHITIPGRPGDLTQLQGEDIYNSYIQTATIMIPAGNWAREVFGWLRGAGYVTFSGEPEKEQKARIIGAITLNKHSYNLDWYTGEVQFYCEPLKQRIYDAAVSVAASGTAVYNYGDVTAKPKITVNAPAAGATLVVSDGTRTLTVDLTGLADTGCVIDCDAQIVTNYSGNANLTSLSSGNFPLLGVGSTTITGSGWSSLQIDRRERFL